MTFYLQSFPYRQIQRRPVRRVARYRDEADQHTLRLNVREQDDAFVLSALVPGLNSDDLNIQVLEDFLRIEGEYKQEENQYLMQDLPYGSFTRTLRLPVPVQAEAVEAKIADGVLTLTLPKAGSARPKQIKIKSK